MSFKLGQSLTNGNHEWRNSQWKIIVFDNITILMTNFDFASALLHNSYDIHSFLLTYRNFHIVFRFLRIAWFAWLRYKQICCRFDDPIILYHDPSIDGVLLSNNNKSDESVAHFYEAIFVFLESCFLELIDLFVFC